MLKELQLFFRDESGPDLVEWLVIVVVAILAVYALGQAFGTEVTGTMGKVRDWVNKLVPQ